MKPFQAEVSLKQSVAFSFVVLAMVGFSGLRGDDPNPSKISTREHNVMAVLWFQTAAEARALHYQAFNLARMLLDAELAADTTKRKRAVVVDVDETVLDNSPYEGRMIQINRGYPFEWSEWIDMAAAKALPGAVEFLNYAVSRGVEVFYVTNRTERDKPATMLNLQRQGFPQVTPEHVMVKAESSSKESRRKLIRQTHHIVLLMGDNLGDFADDFQQKPIAERASEVDRFREEFGKKFIVLPNPIYGDWEDAFYGYERGLSEAEKNKRRKQHLIRY
jgi:5'-nucleotidase (lipoprotein e(P4) family)